MVLVFSLWDTGRPSPFSQKAAISGRTFVSLFFGKIAWKTIGEGNLSPLDAKLVHFAIVLSQQVVVGMTLAALRIVCPELYRKTVSQTIILPPQSAKPIFRIFRLCYQEFWSSRYHAKMQSLKSILWNVSFRCFPMSIIWPRYMNFYTLVLNWTKACR